MKTRTGTILAVCFAIMAFKTSGIEISSQIELDTEKSEETLINATLDEIAKPNGSANPSEPISRVPVFGRRRGSELVKPSEPRKRRIYTSRASVSDTHCKDDSSSQPKVINNIQIIANDNDSIPNANFCKHGICNVSVTSRPDEKGNIITEIHLSIVTSAKPIFKIDDVPVIDGFRGVSEDQSEQSIFRPIDTPNSALSDLHHYNPQIQSNYRENGEPWFQLRRLIHRPQTYWNYHNFDDHGNVEFRGYKTWLPEGPIVDDKIEPPLSRTKVSTTTQNN